MGIQFLDEQPQQSKIRFLGEAAPVAEDSSAAAAEVQPAQQRGTPPSWAAEYPNLYKAAVTTRQMTGPTLEMLGGLAGGAVGTVGTPGIGTLVGAGAGYAGTKQVLRLADQYLGLEPRLSPQDAITRATKDIVEGATMEAGGRVAGQVIGAGVGKFMDARELAQQRAANIARQSVGDVEAARALLATAPEGATAAQALAAPGTYLPTAQALLQRAGKRAPETFGAATGRTAGMTPGQVTQIENELALMAGGPTATAARMAREADVNALNQALLPQRDIELRAINEAEAARQRLQAQATRMGGAAERGVEDVRRFAAAENRALGRAAGEAMQGRAPMSERMVDLANRADQVMTDAAQGSLHFGDARRFAEYGLQSIEAHGLKPLKAEEVITQLQSTLRQPEFAGNRDIVVAMNRVADDIRNWTNSGGVIDAFALDAIRRNSINGAARDLLGATGDVKAQRALAADLLSKVKPAVDRAITEASGSSAYTQYLEAYAKGRQAVEQRQLSAKALQMFESNPDEFVKLVRGNKPEVVEDIFGPGSYNITKEMSQEAMSRLGRAAETAERAGRATEQAGQGQVALRDLLIDNLPKWRVPWGLSVKGAAVNQALDRLEQRVSKKVWSQLVEASKTAESFDDLLRYVAPADRSQILKIVKDPTQYGLEKGAAARGAVNALAPERESENALAR
jgi:hypothetical protein